MPGGAQVVLGASMRWHSSLSPEPPRCADERHPDNRPDPPSLRIRAPRLDQGNVTSGEWSTPARLEICALEFRGFRIASRG
jgi:hypothetical protein